jgi:hypothetical protein
MLPWSWNDCAQPQISLLQYICSATLLDMGILGKREKGSCNETTDGSWEVNGRSGELKFGQVSGPSARLGQESGGVRRLEGSKRKLRADHASGR